MNFAEELRAFSKNAIEDAALTVCINIQPKLKELAGEGRTECFMSIQNDDIGIMFNDEFIKLLSELLDGISVEVVERSISPLFPNLKRKDIHFSW